MPCREPSIPAWVRARRGLAAVAVLLALAGCGELPRPFMGAPGSTAMLLRQPPPARLNVVEPTEALLPSPQSAALQGALIDALVAVELPANADRGRKGEWRLLTTAETRGADVVPRFAAVNGKNETVASTDGAPVPLAQWAAGDPATLKAVADAAAPKILTMFTNIDAAIRQSDPNSLYNRPARVYVAEVDGAPGDGDTVLAAQMRTQLGTLGEVVQDTPRQADFAVEGHVATAPGAGNTTRIEVQWVVRDGADERGRILQLNEVPPGSLDRYWGDIAVAVAKEAAGGVRDVILTQSGRRKPGEPSPPAQPPTSAAPPPA